MKNDRKSANEYPQELWSLFDRYVHGEMDRRTFLDRATKFAVGGLTVAALWEAIRPNYALANEVPVDDKRITTEIVKIPTPKGNGVINGYLVKPTKTGHHPVVIVIHENRGLNPYVMDVARRLAVQGYIALAPDALTTLGGYPGDDEKGGELFKKIDRDKMTEDFVAAATWLKVYKDSNGKLGAVGFCYGGGIANTLAVRLGTEMNGAVPFYGAQPSATEVAKIRAPLLIHDAGLDERIMSGWPAFETALKTHKVDYTRYVYEGSNHGFHNDTTPRYDEKAAKLAWSRTLEFFAKNLK